MLINRPSKNIEFAIFLFSNRFNDTYGGLGEINPFPNTLRHSCCNNLKIGFSDQIDLFGGFQIWRPNLPVAIGEAMCLTASSKPDFWARSFYFSESTHCREPRNKILAKNMVAF